MRGDRRHHALACAIGLAACLLAGPSSANPEAEALIEEGVALRESGNESEALTQFAAAYALEPSPRAAAQMGLAEKSLRRYIDAERHLDEALAAEDDDWVAENREALELARSIVVKHLAWLEVSCSVRGASLTVNGVRLGTLPFLSSHRVLAGNAIIEVEAPGYLPKRVERDILATERTEVTVELEEKAAPPAAPPTPSSPPARTPPSPPPPEPPPSFAPWIIATGTTGAVALGVGIALGVHTLQLKDERDALCPEAACSSTEGIELDDRARAVAVGSTASFILAGTAAAAAIVLGILEPSADADAWWRPRASPSGLYWSF